jgi:hypothetical protein
VSDASQGPGWWQASDGKWYAPDQVSADHVPATPPGAGAPGPEPTDGSPTEFPTYGIAPQGPPPSVPAYAPAYGTPPPGDYGAPPTPGYGPPSGGYGPPAAPGAYGYPGGAPAYGYNYGAGTKTNGLAIASMVCSFFFLIYGIPAILAIIFGFISRNQIKRSQGAQTGGGMALAGIIIGFVGILFWIVVIIVAVAVVNHCNHTGTCANNGN